MRLRLLALAAWVALPMTVPAQTPANPDPAEPDFTITVQGTFDAETLAEFNRRVQAYVALRARLEEGLPPLVVTTNADEIETFERRLGERIRHARASRRGQIFAPRMERQLKRLMDTKADAAMIALIMEDGPGEFDVDVNDRYKKTHSLATMPPRLLLMLPDLPKDLEYRFVGRHLILRDARANIILDEVPHAIRCHDCVLKPEPEESGDSVPSPAP